MTDRRRRLHLAGLHLALALLWGCSGATPESRECLGAAVDDPNGQKNDSWAKKYDCQAAECTSEAICSPWVGHGGHYLEITAGVSACPNGDCTCEHCNCEKIPTRFSAQYYGDYPSLPACMAFAPATGQDWVVRQDGCEVTLSQHTPTGNAGPDLGPFLLEAGEAHHYKLTFSRRLEQTSPDGFGVSHKTSEIQQSYVMNFDTSKGTMVGSLDETFTDFVGNATETYAPCGPRRRSLSSSDLPAGAAFQPDRSGRVTPAPSSRSKPGGRPWVAASVGPE